MVWETSMWQTKTNKLPFFINRFTNTKFIGPTTNIDPNLRRNVIFHSKYVVKGIGEAPSRTILVPSFEGHSLNTI